MEDGDRKIPAKSPAAADKGALSAMLNDNQWKKGTNEKDFPWLKGLRKAPQAQDDDNSDDESCISLCDPRAGKESDSDSDDDDDDEDGVP